MLTKVKVKSINNVDIPDRASNKVRGDTIKFGNVYVCGVKQNLIPGTIFSKKKITLR